MTATSSGGQVSIPPVGRHGWRSILAYVAFGVLALTTLQPDTQRVARALNTTQFNVEIVTTFAQYAALLLLLVACLPFRLLQVRSLAAFYVTLGITTIWSVDQFASLRFTILGLATCLVIAGVSHTLTLAGMVKVGSAVLGLTMVACLLVYKDFSYSVPLGIFTTRNELARCAVYAFAFAVALWICVRTNTWRLIAAACVAVSGYVIFTAGSATAVLVACSLVAILAGRALRRCMDSATFIIASLLASALVLITLPWLTTSVLGALGKDNTLTGRTIIWGLAWDYVGARPITGYGVAAFWSSQPGDAVRSVFGPYAVHAHNAWLDIFLSAGLLLGLVCILLFWAQVLSPLIKGLRASPATAFPYPFVLLSSIFILVSVIYSSVEEAVYRPMYSLTLLTLGLLSRLGTFIEATGAGGGDIKNGDGRSAFLAPGANSVGN